MAMTLITTNTESGAAASAFTSSVDSTYKLYIIKYYGLNPVTDDTDFTFQGSTDGGSSYGVTMTTSFFHAMHTEADDYTNVSYVTAEDIASGTGYQTLGRNLENDADAGGVGALYLFNPSNTTYVKHFYAITNGQNADNTSQSNNYISGYFNTTSAINALNFKMASGNFDGTIKMYGVG